jgi:para-nitrobenzyl esterase
MEGVFGGAGRTGADALAVYAANRPGAESHVLVAAVETDRMFTIPAIRLADAQVRQNPDVWLYRFDWRTPIRGGAHGAHHFIEVPFAFDQIDNPQAAGFLGADPPQKLATATHAAWVAFVKNGNPNNAALPEWPRYDAGQRPTMLFDEPCRVENNPRVDEIALWDSVV